MKIFEKKKIHLLSAHLGANDWYFSQRDPQIWIRRKGTFKQNFKFAHVNPLKTPFSEIFNKFPFTISQRGFLGALFARIRLSTTRIRQR